MYNRIRTIKLTQSRPTTKRERVNEEKLLEMSMTFNMFLGGKKKIDTVFKERINLRERLPSFLANASQKQAGYPQLTVYKQLHN